MSESVGPAEVRFRRPEHGSELEVNQAALHGVGERLTGVDFLEAAELLPRTAHENALLAADPADSGLVDPDVLAGAAMGFFVLHEAGVPYDETTFNQTRMPDTPLEPEERRIDAMRGLWAQAQDARRPNAERSARHAQLMGDVDDILFQAGLSNVLDGVIDARNQVPRRNQLRYGAAVAVLTSRMVNAAERRHTRAEERAARERREAARLGEAAMPALNLRLDHERAARAGAGHWDDELAAREALTERYRAMPERGRQRMFAALNTAHTQHDSDVARRALVKGGVLTDLYAEGAGMDYNERAMLTQRSDAYAGSPNSAAAGYAEASQRLRELRNQAQAETLTGAERYYARNAYEHALQGVLTDGFGPHGFHELFQASRLPLYEIGDAGYGAAVALLVAAEARAARAES